MSKYITLSDLAGASREISKQFFVPVTIIACWAEFNPLINGLTLADVTLLTFAICVISGIILSAVFYLILKKINHSMAGFISMISSALIAAGLLALLPNDFDFFNFHYFTGLAFIAWGLALESAN